jgi:hypothetical protein
MRKFVLASAGIAVFLPVGLIALSPLSAGSLPSITAARPVVDILDAVENVVCYGFGWRGWAVYPGWFRPACTGAYVAPGYVVPTPVYAPAYPGPVYPAANRCWIPPGPDGRPGYWTAC